MARNSLFEVVTTYNLVFHRGCRLRREQAEKYPSHLIWVVPA
jgi:hypothetical protein